MPAPPPADLPHDGIPRLSLLKAVRPFWPYLRPYRGPAFLVLFASLFAPALETATVYLFKLVVDQVLVPRNLSALPRIALAYVALALAGGALGFTTDYLSTSISERFLLDVRSAVFSHLHRLSLDFLDRRHLGDLLARLTTDIAAIESFVLSGAVDAAVHVVRVLFFAGALFFLEARLAVVALVVTPLFWLAARKLSGRLRDLSREKRRRTGALSSVAEESLSNAALVRAYGGEQFEVQRFLREGRAGLKAQLLAARLRAVFSPLVDLLEMGGTLLVLALGTFELSRDRMTLGALLVFITYLGRLYRPVRGLSSFASSAFSASASAERIAELLAQPEEAQRPHAVKLGRSRGAIEFDRVGFRYPGSPLAVLRDLSFRVAPGETLAIVGPSGAGKSTILKLLLRFHEPSEGRILLDGRDLRDLDLADLRRAFAVVLQETLVMHASVRENIAYAKPDADFAELRRAAQLADADEFIAALPGGYDCVVGQKGRLLSGGQRQRLAIARAILRDAPVLLLDEPTAGLDAASERRVLQPLLRLIGGRATIMATHDLSLAALATRIVVLERGEVAQQGTPAELLAQPGPYAWTYQLQQIGWSTEPEA